MLGRTPHLKGAETKTAFLFFFSCCFQQKHLQCGSAAQRQANTGRKETHSTSSSRSERTWMPDKLPFPTPPHPQRSREARRLCSRAQLHYK